MKFSYTALSSDNQKLTGVLEAENLDAANEELHKMGLSIISINEISDEEFLEKTNKESAEKVKTGIQTFMFEAVDTAGKVINGTIDAADDYSAYKRLIIEYKFKVNAIYPSGATEEEITLSKTKIPELEARMKEEGISPAAAGEGFKEDFEKDEIDKEIVQEIDKFIISTKKILEEHRDKFSSDFLQQINKTLGELERIRTSNNLKHISEVCNQLYELISHPDQVTEEAESSDAVYQNILNSMKQTSLVQGEVEIYKKAVGFKKIQSVFKKIINRLTGRAVESKIDIPDMKKAGEKPKGIIKRMLEKLFPKKSKTKTSEKSGFSNVVKNFFSYITAPNAILRKTRKHEFSKAYRVWRESKKKAEPSPKPPKEQTVEQTVEPAAEQAAKKSKGRDFTSFFNEVDSFIAWLLFFYIAYFYLVNFSFEKDLGLSRDFVIKTIKTPLIINITIFLLFAHLILKLKTQYFRRNFLGSLFLIFFGFGIYVLLIVNF